MKKRFLFHFSLLALAVLEFYRMYLLSPIPGSQEHEMVHVSYPLWKFRWILRALFIIGALTGIKSVFERRKWIPVITILASGVIIYAVNFEMSADKMFHEPETLLFAEASKSDLPDDALVISFSAGKESHAYPIRYLAYHHKVLDVVDGQSVFVTYCDVCRSALAFNPSIGGENMTFRLVGMDQFNAMIEDNKSGSWWQQATGICVAGEMKGSQLNVLPAQQMTFGEWKLLFPNGKIMLPDPEFASQYSDETYEKGTIKSSLVGTDTSSWGEKSWVVGIERKGLYRAYDWATLKKMRTIEDTLNGETIVIKIDENNISFSAAVYFEDSPVKTDGIDTIRDVNYHPGTMVMPIAARQMFWHTWRTFYPTTTKYPQ